MQDEKCSVHRRRTLNRLPFTREILNHVTAECNHIQLQYTVSWDLEEKDGIPKGFRNTRVQ